MNIHNIAPVLIISILVLTLLGLILLVSYISFQMACVYKSGQREDERKIPDSDLYHGYQEKMLAVINEIAESQYEEVNITSFDGFKLYGRLIERHKDKPTIISFHGFHGTYAWDGYGAYKLSKALNYNILMVDMRAHGKSESDVITFGIRERFDCRDWVNFVVERYGDSCQIILSGVSMGASTILLATELGLPRNVKALISDCGFTDIKSMQKVTLQKMHVPPSLMFSMIKLGAFLYGHVKLDEMTAKHAVMTNEIPTIFIHGDIDSIVPIRMQNQLYERCGINLKESHGVLKEKLIVQGANHANSALVDYSIYEKNIIKFLNQIPQYSKS